MTVGIDIVIFIPYKSFTWAEITRAGQQCYIMRLMPWWLYLSPLKWNIIYYNTHNSKGDKDRFVTHLVWHTCAACVYRPTSVISLENSIVTVVGVYLTKIGMGFELIYKQRSVFRYNNTY